MEEPTRRTVRGRAVLLVVGVQDEEQVQGVAHDRVDLEILARVAEHHAQEVADVVELVQRIEEGLADRVLVGVGGQGGELGDQPVGRDLDLLGVARVEGVRVERRQRAHHRRARRHRMRVLGQRVEHHLEVFVEHRVPADRLLEGVELRLRRQLPVGQQVGHLHEARVLGELLDRDAAVAQDALLAVDEGDRALARARVRVAGVEGDVAGLRAELGDVDALFALAAFDHVELERLAADAKFCRFRHVDPLLSLLAPSLQVRGIGLLGPCRVLAGPSSRGTRSGSAALRPARRPLGSRLRGRLVERTVRERHRPERRSARSRDRSEAAGRRGGSPWPPLAAGRPARPRVTRPGPAPAPSMRREAWSGCSAALRMVARSWGVDGLGAGRNLADGGSIGIAGGPKNGAWARI